MLRLFLLYAILIFAKRAPKLIAELLKLKGDNIGLKGLNIKNKMGEAPIIGNKVKEGMMGAEGGIRRAVGYGGQLLKDKLKNKGKNLADKTKVSRVGTAMKKGWEHGGDNLKGKLSGALNAGNTAATRSWWSKDARDKNLNSIKSGAAGIPGKIKGIPGKIKTGLKPSNIKSKITSEGSKKFAGNLIVGFSDFRKKGDTKGAYKEGALSADPGYKTFNEGFEKLMDTVKRDSLKKFGLDDDKTAKNRYDRNILGMNTEGDDGGKKIKIDADFAKAFPSVVKANPDGSFSLDASGLEDFKDSKEYKSWNKEKQLTFDKYTGKQTQEDLTTLKACFDQISQLTSAIASARNANTASGLTPEKQGYIPTDSLEEQLKLLNKRVLDIGEQGYTYNKKKVDISNIDNAIAKINEDLSKNSSDMSALKESQKPKENKN